MDALGRRTLAKAGLGAVPPLLLAVLAYFHPQPQDLLKLDVDSWLLVHYAQIPLFPLVALSIAALLGHCRVACGYGDACASCRQSPRGGC